MGCLLETMFTVTQGSQHQASCNACQTLDHRFIMLASQTHILKQQQASGKLVQVCEWHAQDRVLVALHADYRILPFLSTFSMLHVSKEHIRHYALVSTPCVCIWPAENIIYSNMFLLCTIPTPGMI